MINDPAPISISPVDKWGFGSALERAARGGVSTINGFIIFMGYFLPLAIIGSIVYFIFNFVRRDQKRGENASA